MQDLERHLPAEWWRGLFNALYLKTDGDVVEDRAATAAELDRVAEAAGLEPDQAILDLCCGQGRHLLELARRGYGNLTGGGPVAVPRAAGPAAGGGGGG